MKTTRQAYAESDKLLATLEEVNNQAMIDPTKTYFLWKGSQFPNSSSATPVFTNATIDWGDGNSEVGTTSDLSHSYIDGVDYHIISIGNSTSIPNNAFQGCSGIISVKFSQTLKSISQSAFNACTGLTELVIPDNVTSIEANAFVDCSNLKEVYFKSETPPNIKITSFDKDIKFIVPKVAFTEYTKKFRLYNITVIHLTNSLDLTNTLLLDPSSLGREISASAWNDLDSCTLLGNYFCPADTTAGNVNHLPEEIRGPYDSSTGTYNRASAFRLVVSSANGESKIDTDGNTYYPYLAQVVTSYYTGATWYRLGEYNTEYKRYVWKIWLQGYSDQIRTASQTDDLIWGTSDMNKTGLYSRLRVVEELPDSPGTNIIYFITES